MLGLKGGENKNGLETLREEETYEGVCKGEKAYAFRRQKKENLRKKIGLIRVWIKVEWLWGG